MMDGDDIDPQAVARVTQELEISFSVLTEMKLLGTFTGAQIIRHIVAATGLPIVYAQSYAQHVMGPMLNKTLTVNPDGTFTYAEPAAPTIADHMKSFRAMLTPSKSSSGPSTKGH
jgi:hypothetical protein